jgi:hypothetical protein
LCSQQPCFVIRKSRVQISFGDWLSLPRGFNIFLSIYSHITTNVATNAPFHTVSDLLRNNHFNSTLSWLGYSKRRKINHNYVKQFQVKLLFLTCILTVRKINAGTCLKWDLEKYIVTSWTGVFFEITHNGRLLKLRNYFILGSRNLMTEAANSTASLSHQKCMPDLIFTE